MAITEVTGVMKYKDADGNTYIMLPATTKENVEGLEEVDAHLLDKENPHGVTAEQIGAASEALVNTLSTQVAYVDSEDNEDVVDPDISATSVTIDSSLSETSTNPVQNKAITKELSNLSKEIDDLEKEKADTSYVDEEIAYAKASMAQYNILVPEVNDTVENAIAWLNENGDTTGAYVLADGYYYLYTKTTTGGGGEALFTNELDSVTKNINYRWSRSSKALSAQMGYMTVTIPVVADQKVYVNLPLKAFQGSYARIHYLDSSNNYVSTKDQQASKIQNITTDDDGVSSWVVGYEFGTADDASTNARLSNADNIVSMVLVLGISYYLSGSNAEITEDDVADIILSLDNPIEYSTSSTTYGWVNSGVNIASYDADRDALVAELQQKTNSLGVEITELEEAIKNIGTETDVDAIEYIKEWDSPIYDKTPVYQLSSTKSAITSDDKTVEAIYAKYDALMAEHSDYITKTDLGLCSDGETHVYRYDFKEAEPHHVLSNYWSETKPKIIIMSGAHKEFGGIYSLYYALEEIATNSDLDELRRNLHLIVIPVMNPYCIIGDVWNKNYNGIEVRRNFEVGFEVLEDTTADHYAGTEALSEVESQYIDAILQANTDSAYFLSCHSMTRESLRGTGFVWGSSATNYMCNIAFRIIDKMSKAWHTKYGTTWEDGIAEQNAYVLSDSETYPNAIEQESWDYRAGWASISQSAGTEQRQATKYGIQATNLEVCDYFRVLDNVLLSEVAMTHGAEVYINFLLTAMGVYDHKDKDVYFKG